MQDIAEKLNGALATARSAVEADEREDYAQAIKRYKDTLFALDAIKDRVTPPARNSLMDKYQRYQRRMEVLEKAQTPQQRPSTTPTAKPAATTLASPVSKPINSPSSIPPSFATQTPPATTTTTTPSPTPKSHAPLVVNTHNRAPGPMPTLPPFNPAALGPLHSPLPAAPSTPKASPQQPPYNSLFFVEEQIINVPMPDRPENTYKRTLWLVSLLYQTMTTGGFLSPKLYVTNAVWSQGGAKVSAVQHKVTGLTSVLEGLTKLLSVDKSNTDEATRQLDEFCNIIHGVQGHLSKHLSFIKEPKDEKKGLLKNIGTGMTRLQGKLSTGSDDTYMSLLKETFEKARGLDKWLSHFEGNISGRQAAELLHRVCDFFYNVVIAFVFRDFNTLLLRYVKKSHESFFED